MKMELKIKSRVLGKAFTFMKDTSGSYVSLYDPDSGRTVQICEGGGFWDGPTVMCPGDDQKQFEKTCRNWYRAHLKNWPRE